MPRIVDVAPRGVLVVVTDPPDPLADIAREARKDAIMAAALMMACRSRIVAQSIIFLPRILGVAVTRRVFQA